ncbi:dolichol-P-glucose synthetase [Virgisporangium aurantiacum]|uniref:Dolichol-P-glucose synthetase n=2 Tax=Virgisporangium aurantiacum TaxID=175570 RepID=A0A8J3ZJL3_9ACTN|nr:dolichol-P-glucose synthetase [Virgisporangium aurantiacum]
MRTSTDPRTGACMPSPSVEVTVLLPCLNEAETLAVCVQKAVRCLAELGVDGEVLVSDNGSTDGSQQIAEANGARVVAAPIRGYGGALQAGIEAARGRYVIMADSDDSYDLSNLGPFIERLREGNDVVMGNRFKGGIAPGAMPFLHKYLGNPVLSLIGRVLFGLKHVGDFHCGIRGFNRARIQALGLCMPGMEFASELVVRAALAGYTLVEVPTTLRPDGRSRPPHLRTWRDGWRHLRFLLVFAPRKILVWPGAVLGTIGLVGTAALAVGQVSVGFGKLDVNGLIYACLLLIVGVQLVLFGGFAELYGRHEGITHVDHAARWTKLLRLETCMAIGLLLMLVGAVGTAVALTQWSDTGFGALQTSSTIRWVLVSTTSVSLGFIIICSGLFSSLLTLRSARPGRLVFDADDQEELIAAR